MKIRKARANKKAHKKYLANAAESRGRGFSGGTLKTGTYHGTNSKRDLWKVGGLPDELQFDDLFNVFRRNGLAKAGVMKPIERCWRTTPVICDGIYDKNQKRSNTDFENDIDVLINKHKLFERLIGLDYRQRIGRYGGIVIIGKEDPTETPSSDKKMKGLGIEGLVKLMPVFESQILVTEDIGDICDPNFGSPRSYNFNSSATGGRTNSSTSATLHPSRVFAFGEGADDGTIYGKSSLEAPFNALLDWEKVRISAAEGYFKNAKQRIVLNVNDTQTASAFLVGDNKAAFDKNVDDFGNGWDSSLLLSGMDVTAIQSSITDPTSTSNLCLQEICAGFNIQKTILIGFETGERSSTENSEQFNEDMMTRRERVLTEMIIGFLNNLIENGYLSKPKSGFITVNWDDLLSSSDTEKLDNATKMSAINQTAYNSGGFNVFTEEEIREAAGFDNVDDTPAMTGAGYEDEIDASKYEDQ